MKKQISNSEIIETIKFEIQNLERRISEDQKKLNENFVYYFSWCGEDLFMNNFKLEYYREVIIESDKNSDLPVETIIQHYIKTLNKFIAETHNVRVNSSGSLHREVSTWKFIASMEINKFFNSLLK